MIYIPGIYVCLLNVFIILTEIWGERHLISTDVNQLNFSQLKYVKIRLYLLTCKLSFKVPVKFFHLSFHL